MITSKTIYFLTCHNIVGLIAKPNGIAHRLKSVMLGCQQTGARLVILWFTPRGLINRDGIDIQSLLRSAWNVECEVINLECTYQPATFYSTYLYPFFMGAAHSPEFPKISQTVVDQVKSIVSSPSKLILFQSYLLMPGLYKQLAGNELHVDYNDVEHVAFQRRLKLHPKIRHRILDLTQVFHRRALDFKLMKSCKSVLVCSKHDVDYLRNELKINHAVAVNNAVDAPPCEHIDSTGGRTLLFVGSMRWQPNIDAVDFFLLHVFPKVLSVIPDVSLTIVGDGSESVLIPPDLIRSVNVLGYVESLGKIYKESGIAICPILSGSGTRVKLVEAASYGKAIVSTSIGCEGLEFVNGKNCLIEDESEGFAQAICKLINDQNMRAQIGKEAYNWFLENCERGAQIKKLTATLSQAMKEAS